MFFLSCLINLLRHIIFFCRIDDLSLIDDLFRLVCLLKVRSSFIMIIDQLNVNTFSDDMFLYCFTYRTSKLFLLNFFLFLFFQIFYLLTRFLSDLTFELSAAIRPKTMTRRRKKNKKAIARCFALQANAIKVFISSKCGCVR